MENVEIKCLEFFSGIGGLHWGLHGSIVSAESSVLGAFDNNEIANKVYKFNFPTVNIQNTNIEHRDSKYFDSIKANCWLMSPPCQPYTRGGKLLDHRDNRARGLIHMIKILSIMRFPPQYLFLENVKNFETSNSRNLLVFILQQRGYTFEEYLVSPTDPSVNIPNDRLRYYLSAIRKNDLFPPLTSQCVDEFDRFISSSPSPTPTASSPSEDSTLFDPSHTSISSSLPASPPSIFPFPILPLSLHHSIPPPSLPFSSPLTTTDSSSSLYSSPIPSTSPPLPSLFTYLSQFIPLSTFSSSPPSSLSSAPPENDSLNGGERQQEQEQEGNEKHEEGEQQGNGDEDEEEAGDEEGEERLLSDLIQSIHSLSHTSLPPSLLLSPSHLLSLAGYRHSLVHPFLPSSPSSTFTKSYGGQYKVGTGSVLVTRGMRGEGRRIVRAMHIQRREGPEKEKEKQKLKVTDDEDDDEDENTGEVRVLAEEGKEGTGRMKEGDGEEEVDWFDTSSLSALSLRLFSPTEIALLHAFPLLPIQSSSTTSHEERLFSFPPDISLAQQFRLLGNSLNVKVVSVLLNRLFSQKFDL